MTKIKLLRQNVLESLRADVERNLPRYRNGDFEFLRVDPANYREAAGTVNEAVLAQVRLGSGPEFDLDNCRTIYGALPGLSPYDARDERLWTYLTHVQLIEYTRQRWPIPENDEQAVAHIRLHFFARDKRGIERDNAASRLWWMAHLCNRVVGLDSTAALRILLGKTDIRANIIERPTVSQSTQLFSAVLRVLAASRDGDRRLLERSRYRRLMAEINSIGGYRLLDHITAEQADRLVAAVAEKVLAEPVRRGNKKSQASEAA
jgi:hypothetical protein